MILQYEIDKGREGKVRIDLNKCKVIQRIRDNIIIDGICIEFDAHTQAEKAYEGIVAEIDRINEEEKHSGDLIYSFKDRSDDENIKEVNDKE